MIDLFQEPNGGVLYNQIKNDEIPWHSLARNHWNEIYDKYSQYLDLNFVSKLPHEFINCLWELKLINYLGHLTHGNLAQISKGDITIPDFKWMINNKHYYIEATCASKGLPENYPYLNKPLSQVPSAHDGTVGHREYRERITGAFREKAVCKYDPNLCDLSVCKHKHKNGYKENIKDSGFIIAISMADIDFYNQPMNWRVDLSCFFPCSPYTTINITKDGNIHDTYHDYQPLFNKGDKETSPISVSIFDSPKYSHVSAVLISHCWQVLFPNLAKHELTLNFNATDNDFMLIHNPFAAYKLEPYSLPVHRELVAKHEESTFTINTLGLIPELLKD